MEREEYLQLRNNGDIDEIAFKFYKEKAEEKSLKVYDKDFFLNALNLWANLNKINVVHIITQYFDNLFTVSELSQKQKPLMYY